jgi:ribosomal silencing factor RsfS
LGEKGEKVSNIIFVSYNPKEEIEQSTALRLQTLSSLYGASVLLPDRYNSKDLQESTKERILKSGWCVVFSTKSLTKVVREELHFALQNGKNILVIYSRNVGKILDLDGVVEYTLDSSKQPDQIIAEIMEKIKNSSFQLFSNKDNKIIWVILGVGLGLFSLWLLGKDDKK